MSSLNKLSRVLYQASRTTRDINALSRGPSATAKRAGRKLVWRSVAKGLRKLGA